MRSPVGKQAQEGFCTPRRLSNFPLRRSLALVSALVVAFSILPSSVFAADEEKPEQQQASRDQVSGHQIKTRIEDVSTEESHPEPIPEQSLNSGGTLKGTVQKNGELGALLDKVGLTIKGSGTDTLPAKVVKVESGSPAAKRNVALDDTLVSQVVNNDGSLTLTMEHAGQGFRFTIKANELAAWASKHALTVQTDKTQLISAADKTKLQTGTQENKANLATDTKKRQFKTMVDLMENHDLGLIIDRSGSMHTPDCPGGLSRWNWCCQEATQLGQAAAQASSSIDASIFNSSYLTYRHITPAQIPQIFLTNQPEGGTEPAYALQEQLENYFSSDRKKPLTIVVVTDGCPNNGRNTAQVLQDESKKIRYQGEVTITFLLISDEVDDSRLRNLIGLAPGSSVKNGGFVDIVPFADLETKGIKQSLFDDLKEIRLSTNQRKPSSASASALGPAAVTQAVRHSSSQSVKNYGNGVRDYHGTNYGLSGPGLRNYAATYSH